MSKDTPGFTFTAPAGEATIYPHRALYQDTDGTVKMFAGVTGNIVGVSQNKTTAVGQAVSVVSSGITLVEVGTAVTTVLPGQELGILATGTATNATGTTKDALLGIAQEANTAAGQLIGVLLAGPSAKRYF